MEPTPNARTPLTGPELLKRFQETGDSGTIPFPTAEFEAALEREQDARDFAFAGVGTEICGIPVRLITLRDALILQKLGSPLIVGGVASPEEIAEFLWYLSPDFDAKIDKTPWKPALWQRLVLRFGPQSAFRNPKLNPNAFQALMLALAFIPYTRLYLECRDYMDTALLDAPESTDSKRTPFSSFMASYCDELGNAEYGYSRPPMEIANIPLAILFQLIREIQRRRNPDTPMINRFSDKVKADWLKQVNKKGVA